MRGKKKVIQQVVYGFVLLVAVLVVFQWYAVQNRKRMEERNKNYAADSATLTVAKINEDLNDALDLIKTYAYFMEKGMNAPVIEAQTLIRCLIPCCLRMRMVRIMPPTDGPLM